MRCMSLFIPPPRPLVSRVDLVSSQCSTSNSNSNSGAARHDLGEASHVSMTVAGQRRGAPGSVVVDSKAASQSLHAARLLYGNRDFSGTRRSSWRDLYGERSTTPTTRATRAATSRRERHFQVASSVMDSLPAVKSVVTGSSCGTLEGGGDEVLVDAQSFSRRPRGSREMVRGSPDNDGDEDGLSNDATRALNSSMQHAAAWDGESRGGSREDFGDDRDRLDESGDMPSNTIDGLSKEGAALAQSRYGDARAVAFDDDTGLSSQGRTLPVLSRLGSEIDCYGASVDTDTRPRPSSRVNSKRGRRKNTRGSGSKSSRPAVREPSTLEGGWSLSRPGQTEMLVRRQRERLAAAEKEAVITRMLQTFAGPTGGKSTRVSDFVNMVGRDRGSILIREEIHRALADRNVILRDEELTSLMEFFDFQGRGYVTLGDVRDSLEALRQGQPGNQQSATNVRSSTPPRIQPPQLPDGAESTRLGSALLAPLVLFTSPEQLDRSKKRRRAVNKGGGAQWCRWEAGMGYLDITDPEIGSLADFLMGIEEGGAAKQRAGHQPSDGNDHDDGKRHIADGARFEDGSSRPIDQPNPSRPLSTVMTVMRSAAVRASKRNAHGERSYRGPGAAAIPSSAARVCRVLAALQNLWRENSRRRRRMVGTSSSWRGPDEFSDEELGTAVRLFEIDGIGSIELQDVTTVFRSVRAGKFARRRPIAAVIPTLASLGRYLEERAVTADDFVQEAASTTTSVSPHASGGHHGEMTFTTKNKQGPNGSKRPATAAQMGALLSKEMKLTAQQLDLVLDCVADNGLVWGANLAWAVQRARIELGHGHIKRQEQQRGKSGGGYTSEGSEIKSQAPESLIGSDPGTTSLPRTRQAVSNNKGVAVPRLEQRRPRGKPVDGGIFDHYDASLVISIFVGGGGGVRSLTADTAVSLWRALKRKQHGIHTSEIGRSTSRGLCQLFRHLAVKPQQWFATLDAKDGGEDKSSGLERRVMVSSVIAGVKRLITDTGSLSEGVPSAERGVEMDEADSEVADEDEKPAHSGKGKGSSELLAGVRRAKKWGKKELLALAGHLDPCGAGSVTTAEFQEGLRDSQNVKVAYPDASQLAAAHRFEAVLRRVGCEDVCGLIKTLTKGGRGGGDLVEYVRRMGDGALTTAPEVVRQQDKAPRAVSVGQQEIQRTSEHASALKERLAQPENADALKIIERIDELMTKKGKCPAVEFNQADARKSGGVNAAELEQVIDKLVRPCTLLRSERKQRQERQEAAAAAVQRAESSKEFMMQKMEALHRSKASNFLEAISRELRRRRLQIRDVFQAVEQGRSGSLDVDGLLENSYRALGLSLDRSEAEALISLLDVNGDRAIQCEELEFTMRSYRRYMWERSQWTKKRPFHEEYPSLSCLFSTAQGVEVDVQLRNQTGSSNANKHDTPQLVSREDVVAALRLLRGDSNGGRGGILPAKGANGRRQQMFVRAIRKIAHCCQDAGVMTRPAFHATLVRFDFWPAGKARRNADRMRTIDVWHWLRLLTVPPYYGGGGGGSGRGGRGRLGAEASPIHGRRPEEGGRRNKKAPRIGDGGGGATGDEMVGARLLSREETSLVIEALEYRSSLGENARTGTDGVFISVNTFWDVMSTHAPGVVDLEAQNKLDAIEAARQQEIRERESAAALIIQCLTRQRQARKKILVTREIRVVEAEAKRKDSAAIVLQCAARKKQAKKALETARLRRAAAEEAEKQAAALTLQCALRQWQARKIRDEKAEIFRQAAMEKKNAAILVQCAVRQRQARAHVREKAAEQLREEERRLHQIKCDAAATRIQAIQRGRLARQRAAEAAAARVAEAQAKAELEEAARILAAATKAENEARAAVQIQCAARQRRARKETAVRFHRRQEKRDAEARVLAAEEAKRAEAVKIQSAAVKMQSVVRGWLVRVAVERAAEKAALDAAIAARRAQLAAQQAQADEASRGQTEWRKKSVVGARGVAGWAGLTVQAAGNE